MGSFVPDITAEPVESEVKTMSFEPTMPDVELAHGAAAHALLRSPSFQKDWTYLAAACPWGTTFQSFRFAETWLSIYRDLYEGLLVFQYDAGGNLVGLLPLAVDNSSGAIVHVGAHQAEYQVWLAFGPNSELFIQRALDLLLLSQKGKPLKLKYLPPGTPLSWRNRWKGYSILHHHKRPLLAVGAGSNVPTSLRKKANKSKLNRLKRLGPLRLVRMQTRAELEPLLDIVADFYDLRQGAISSSTPFRDDPRKKEFTLRLLDTPGLAHASVLMVGDIPIAANIGVITDPFVSIGITGHSPFYAQCSPGKMHILMLAQHLGREGFQDLDLTPGGSYKDQLADHSDQAHELDVHIGQATYAWEASKLLVRAATRKLVGGEGRAVVTFMRQLGARHVDRLLAQALRVFKKVEPSGYYSITSEMAKEVAAQTAFRVNSISDLLLYKPVKKSDQSRQAFFQVAARNLEAGGRVYTLSCDGELMHCAWLSHWEQECCESCLLRDGYTHPEADRIKLKKLSLAQRIHDAGEIAVDRILIECRSDESSIIDNWDLRFKAIGRRGVARFNV